MDEGPGSAACGGRGTPSAALDGYVDARAAFRAGATNPASAGREWHELTGLVEELGLLGEETWDGVVPVFGRKAPPLAPGSKEHVVRGPRQVGPGRASGDPRRRMVPAAVAAAVVAAGVVLATMLAGQPAPRPASRTGAAPAAWRLTGYIDEPTWQVGGSAAGVGVAPAISCPSDTGCYAVDPWSLSGAGVLETTVDGGQTWHQSTLTGGLQFTSGLACLSVDRCLAAGAEQVPGEGQAALVLSTSDGGGEWSAVDLPPSVTELSQFTCAPGGTCVGAGYGSSPSPGVPPPPVVVTSGPGGPWQVVEPGQAFGGFTADGISCTSTSDCVIVGAVTDATSPKAAAIFSTDGGRSWNEATLPPGLAQVKALSCPDRGHCLAIADPPGRTGSASRRRESEILATADGGRTWTSEGPAGAVPLGLTSISCATSSECWATGQSAITPVGAVVRTTDGGVSWTAVQLPGSAGQTTAGSNGIDVQNVSTVSCTAGGACTALGAQVSPPAVILQVVLRSD